jgi:murein DD-endopeptidase MepM/ murein hydrolase activator NlpD
MKRIDMQLLLKGVPMRRAFVKVLVLVVMATASVVAAAPASAGPPWAMIDPTWGTVTGQVGDCRDGCSRRHAGIDIANPTGTDVLAAYRGTAYERSDPGGYGIYVDVIHPNGYMTRYAHLNQDLIANGQRVERGTHIGEMGSTGGSTGPHLHFEARHNGNPININAAFPRYSTVTGRAAMDFDYFLVANPDIAPFTNELHFVAQHYSDFLRRPISSGEAVARIDQLWNGTPGLDQIHEIWESPEAEAKIRSVVRLYYAAFDRHPDNGIRSWLGRSLSSVSSGLLNSDEGKRKLPTDPVAFVRAVYRHALNREPDSAGLWHWVDRVNRYGRARVLLEISDSTEHKRIRYGLAHVHTGYLAMLNRVPESTVRSDWAGRINHARGFAIRDLIQMIRFSAEYRGRVF